MPREKLRIIDRNKVIGVLRESTIGFDVDGVEAATSFLALQLFNEKYPGQNKTVKDLTGYGVMINWIAALDPDNALEKAIAIWNDNFVVSEAERVKGVLTVLNYLRINGIEEPHRITSRPGFVRGATIKWLQTKNQKLPKRMIHAQRQGSAMNKRFKAERVHDLGINFHFEDSSEDAEKIVSMSDATVVLVPQPWNWEYSSSSPRIITVNSPTTYPMLDAFQALLVHLDSNR